MPDRCPTGLFIVEYFFKCSIIVYLFRRRLSTVWRQKIRIFSWKGRASPAIQIALPHSPPAALSATAPASPTTQYKEPPPRRAEISTKRQENTAPRAAPISFASPPRAEISAKKQENTAPRAAPIHCASPPRAEISAKRQENTAPRAAPIPLHISAAPRRNFHKKTRKYRPAHDVRGAAAADRSGPCFVCSRCVRSAR